MISQFGGNVPSCSPSFRSSAFEKKKLREKVALSAWSGVPGSSPKHDLAKPEALCVPETSNQQPQEEKAKSVTSGAAPPREGRVLPLRDDAPFRGDRDGASIHGCAGEEALSGVLGDSGAWGRPATPWVPLFTQRRDRREGGVSSPTACPRRLPRSHIPLRAERRTTQGEPPLPTLRRNILAVYLKDTSASRPRTPSVLRRGQLLRRSYGGAGGPTRHSTPRTAEEKDPGPEQDHRPSCDHRAPTE